MLKYSAWLNFFLQRRGLLRPDQRPLYEYQCTEQEYLELRGLLYCQGESISRAEGVEAYACIVLFGAEWYRREYLDKHGWSWESINQVLGSNLAPSVQSKVVEKGLEGYWLRSIHLYEAGRRNLLGSVLAEGGLPFQMLKAGGSRFQTLFDRVLNQYDDLHLLGYSSYQQIELQLNRVNLPQVFSSPQSVELIARMADRLVALVRDYNLAQTNEPVTKLDAVHPKWRELFPLPLDNETGTELLNGLLKKATAERKVRRGGVRGWSCEHFWNEVQPDELLANISLPEEIVFNLITQPSTTRLNLTITEGNQAIAQLGAGYATVEDKSARIRLRQREVGCRRRILDAQLNLVVTDGGITIATVPIQGSVIALGEVPLGFELKNNRWQLCGQASFNTAAEELLLCLPENSEVNVIESTDDIAFSEVLKICSLRTVKLLGKKQLKVTSDDELYRIRTGHAADTGMGLELSGSKLDWITKPPLTFVGLPRAQLPTSVLSEQQGCSLYAEGKPLGSNLLQEALGSQFISIRNNDGDTLLRRKVGVLPADFLMELKSGESPKSGSIIVHTQQTCLLQVTNDDVRVQQIRHDNYVELRLKTEGMPPVKLHLLVTPGLMNDPIQIELPFPSSGSLAFDANGFPLKHTLCVSDLLGTRLYLFPRTGNPSHYGIELTLNGSIVRNAYYKWSYIVTDKPLEISLFNIREQIIDLLSLQSGIDQVVMLRVYGGYGPDAYYSIYKHATEMKYDPGRQVVFAANFQDSDVILPEPTVMLLHEPERKAVILHSRASEGVPTGEFELPNFIHKNGPWLVIPKAGSKMSFRPQFIAGNFEFSSENDGLLSLKKAVLAFEPNSEANIFTSILNTMTQNPEHSGWAFLRNLYDNHGHLPLATFEVWKALLEHPAALAMACFKFEMNPHFLERLEAEFPFFWEFYPIEYIASAKIKFAEFLLANELPKEIVQELVEKMLLNLGSVFPSYGDSVQKYLGKGIFAPEVSLPTQAISSAAYNVWYQDLLRDRSDAKWPEFESKKLEQWHSSQDNSLITFTPELNYRNSVVYLPVFAAAVASGKAQVIEVFENSTEAVFFLRQVRDFDSKWFDAVYQYCLLKNVKG